jgi:hypothetical protein
MMIINDATFWTLATLFRSVNYDTSIVNVTPAVIVNYKCNVFILQATHTLDLNHNVWAVNPPVHLLN